MWYKKGCACSSVRIEQRIPNPRVGGSSPFRRTDLFPGPNKVLRHLYSINIYRLTPRKRIFVHYTKDPDLLKEYFSFLPTQIDQAIERIRPKKVLIDGLKEYNEGLGAGEETLNRIDLLSKNDSFVVMTGHQPCLFLGPLLTLYKAIHAIKLANQLSSLYSINVVPVFWNVSEDDDWQEVNHLYILRDDEIEKVEARIDDGLIGASMGDIPLNHLNLDEVLKRMKEGTISTEFKEDVFKMLRALIDRSKGFAQYFSSLILALLSRYGLVVFDPKGVDLHDILVELFRCELEDPLATTSLVNEAGKRLFGSGYRPQIHKDGRICSLFIKENGLRSGLRYDGSLFKTKDHNYSKEEILEILKESPSRFTTNVALRPILASMLFPILCYVGGPSEVSYYAQLKGVYKRYNLVMPVVIPRVSLTLIEQGVRRTLERLSIMPWELMGDLGGLYHKLIKEEMAQDLGNELERIRGVLEKGIDSLKEKFGGSEPNLDGVVNRAKRRIGYGLKELEDSLIKIFKNREDILLKRLKKARNSIYPNGDLQERSLNILYFLIKYGLSFMDDLYQSFPLDYKEHHYLSIEI